YPEEKGMRHNSTILRQVLEVIDRGEFHKSIEECEADWHGRNYKSWDQLVLQTLVQIRGVQSLRELCTLLQTEEAILYHLGTKVHKRSTISDAGFRIPYQVFEKTFYRCLSKCNRLTYGVEKGPSFIISFEDLGFHRDYFRSGPHQLEEGGPCQGRSQTAL